MGGFGGGYWALRSFGERAGGIWGRGFCMPSGMPPDDGRLLRGRVNESIAMPAEKLVWHSGKCCQAGGASASGSQVRGWPPRQLGGTEP